MAAQTISWETIEHPYYEKSGDWYWIVGIIGAVVTFLAFLFGNILLSIFAVIATIAVMLNGARVPNIVEVIIGQHDIRVGNMVFPYTEVESFAITEGEDLDILVLVTRGYFLSHIHVPIENVDVDTVREALHENLDESYYEESFFESLSHYLGL